MTEEDLDLSWINDEEQNININTVLLPVPIKNINTFLFYIDLNNHIKRIVKTKNINSDNIQNNILNNDFLKFFINKNSLFNNKDYSFFSIGVFIFNCNLNSTNYDDITEHFMFYNIDSNIILKNSIPFFNDINSIFFLFKEKSKKNEKHTFIKEGRFFSPLHLTKTVKFKKSNN